MNLPKLEADELRCQLEFYFHPMNVATDRYMRLLLDRDPANWVPLSEISVFNRIRENSIDELRAAISSSSILVLDETSTKVRTARPTQKIEDLPDHMIYLFNPSNHSHQSIKQFLADLGGPVPIKVGCKRDNESQAVYGAKLYFESKAQTFEFINRHLKDSNGAIKGVIEESSRENGMALYRDYLKMMRDVSDQRKNCLLLLKGMKGYDIKGRKNELKAMIKRAMVDQKTGVQNVLVHDRELKDCLLIFESAQKAQEALKIEDLGVDGAAVTLHKLEPEDVDKILGEMQERRMKGRIRHGAPFRRGRGRARGGRRGRGRGGPSRGRRGPPRGMRGPPGPQRGGWKRPNFGAPRGRRSMGPPPSRYGGYGGRGARRY